MVKCNWCKREAKEHTYKQWEEHERLDWQRSQDELERLVAETDSAETSFYYERMMDRPPSPEYLEQFREGQREIYNYKKELRNNSLSTNIHQKKKHFWNIF